MTAIKAHFDGKVLVLDEPVDLPVNQPLEVYARPFFEKRPPLMELADALSQLPPDPNSPTDGAAQHDHYLYGTPKRDQP
jgi:hypothetical protein